MFTNINYWSDKIRDMRQKTVYNIRNSGKIGAEIISKKLSIK